MENHRYLVKITPVHSANEHQVFMREYAIWKQVVNTLVTLSFVADKKKTVVKFDWGNAIETLSELETYKNVERGKEKVDQETRKELFAKRWRNWDSGDDKINLTCTVLTEEKHDPEQFVKQFLFLLYLCINIAEPGAGGISAEISALDSSKKESKDLVFYLTSEPFEHVDIPLRELSYPPFIDLNFQEVWNWLEKIGIINQSVAESNIQRAIFAMLNYCQNDSYMYPTGLLWLSLGLEALYDLPSIGISSALRERVFLTLGAPKNSKQIKRLMADFYSLRSKFVHGDFEIINPIAGNAYLTNELMEKYEVPVWNANYFGMAIMVATLQKMISEDWIDLHFETILSAKSKH